ncbi:hypothetical protein CBS101457_002881 [Exobasidium rhododendri]|nr:hypothetical protein CBS101457_002881 [Exobasidium rhododendri]
MAPKRGEKRGNPVKAEKDEAAPPPTSKKTKSSKSAKKEDDGVAASPEKKESGSDSKSRRISTVEKLLSEEMQKIAYPQIPRGHGEVDWPAGTTKRDPPKAGSGKKSDKKAKGSGDTKELRTYASPGLTPFEQLVCASLLSRPFSHVLGLRAIQTLFNPPFSLTTPKAMEEAGYEGRGEALWEARTQHKGKTAEQLGDLVEGLRKIAGSDDEEEAIHMSAVRDAAKKEDSHQKAVEKVRDLLTSNIKGVGPMGVDIFLRRVQAQKGWESVYPFIDKRGLGLAVEFGLVDDTEDVEVGAEALSKLLGGDKDKFVKILDTLIGIDLEKKTSEVLQELSA